MDDVCVGIDVVFGLRDLCRVVVVVVVVVVVNTGIFSGITSKVDSCGNGVVVKVVGSMVVNVLN